MNTTSSPYLMTPSQHRVRAMGLRAWNPNSRAAELHDLAANLKDRQARLGADRATLAANLRRPAPLVQTRLAPCVGRAGDRNVAEVTFRE
jgi:hypothetical protein